MALPQVVPVAVRRNHDQIAEALSYAEQSDEQLAAALWESYQKAYFRLFGYRSLAEYLREAWSGTRMASIASIRARSVQRLIREYRLALDIPLFKANFDKISRSNRRLLAQVITPETAEHWIAAAVTMTSQQLEAMIRKQPLAETRKAQRLYLSIYPETRELWERAKVSARQQIAAEGGDPGQFTDALVLEMLCQEFLATYGGITPERARELAAGDDQGAATV